VYVVYRIIMAKDSLDSYKMFSDADEEDSTHTVSESMLVTLFIPVLDILF
jgi:hypothetical protein